MGKNTAMLKIFFRALRNDSKTVDLVIPKSYVKSIYDIDYEMLKKNKIKNIVFDIDNTIMPVNDIYVDKNLNEFIDDLKKDFNICILSNNNKKRVVPVQKVLDVYAIYEANKPNKEAYDKICDILDTNGKNTALVGDQMLSDIVFANSYGLYSILVEPFKNKYDIKTGTSRVLQNILMKRLKNKIQRYKYY